MPSVGTASSAFTSVTKTTTYTAVAGQYVLADATSAAFTVTLPATPSLGIPVAVKKTDSSTNAVTVVASGVATIDGRANVTLPIQYGSVECLFDGTNWQTNSISMVPAGGATGQVLAKASGTDYATGWATPASGGGGGQVPWSGGRWFTKPGPLYGATAFASSITPNASGGTVLFPHYIPNACTISQVAFYINTSTISFKLALYTDNSASTSTGPTTLIGTQASGGPSGPTTLVTQAVTGWTIPSAGLYWLAYCASGGAALSAWVPTMNFSTSMSTPPVQSSSTQNNYLFTTAFTSFSTLPASLASTAMTAANSSNEPVFSFKAS